MGHTPLLDTFLNLHQEQLMSSGIPVLYWGTLFKKLTNYTFDAGTSFQMMRVDYDLGEERLDHEPVWVLQAGKDFKANDENDIFLIDHAWTFNIPDVKTDLRILSSTRARLCNMLDISQEGNLEEVIEEIFKHMWKLCGSYSIRNTQWQGALPYWYIMDELGSAVMHSDEPNCRMVPFFYHNDKTSYSLLFPTKAIEGGTLMARDRSEGITDPIRRAAVLLPWQPHSFKHLPTKAPIPGADYFLQGHIEESLPDITVDIKRPNHDEKYKVFTEYDLIKEFLKDKNFEIVDNEEEANILWYTRHFKDYADLSQTPQKFVNQFPFEYVITIKDLLSITCRRGGSEPAWLPTTYNLVTEIGNFISYYQQREEKKLNNTWIIKPYNLARGLDTHVTDNLNLIASLSVAGPPKIAQKYIENPVLFYRPECGGKVKFDIRYIIILCSVKPLKAFVYKQFFLRFANKPFELNDFTDYEKHFTVMNYKENTELHRMLCSEFKTKWENQYPAVLWDDVEKSIHNMFKMVLRYSVKETPPCGIAESPQSRALYAADLMLEWSKDNCIQPKLLEVNWTPDCQRACDYYHNFYDDIFKLMFLDKVSDQFYELKV